MKTLNQNGFAHWIAPLFVIALVALIGLHVLTDSHADTNDTGTIEAWGRNDVGDLGQGYKGLGSASSIPIKNLSGVTKVVANYGGNLTLLNDGTVRVWGGNVYGQLGQGDQADSYIPETVPGLRGTVATAISGNQAHDMVLMNDGTVYVWGGNGHGTTGNGTAPVHHIAAKCLDCVQFVPYHIPNLNNVVEISAGGTDDMVLLKNGTVMAWGDNAYGELGYDPNTFVNPYKPVVVPGLKGVKQVVAGSLDNYAVMNNGTVMAWGINKAGELGNGKVDDKTLNTNYIPTPVLGLNNVVAMSSGGGDNLAILANGNVMAWGRNDTGQLGIGSKGHKCFNGTVYKSFSCSPVPVLINGLKNVTDVSAGEGFSLAVSKGNVYSWGINDHTTLGSGNRISTDVPGPVINISGVKQVSAGTDHSLALH